MKLDDLNLKIGDKLPYDVAEDLTVYMRNDPNFYRKHFFPALLGVQETVKNGGKYNKRDMLPVLEKAIANYVQKYNIKKRPNDLMSEQDCLECIDKILRDEADNFRNEVY